MSEINQLRFGAALRQRREELKLSLDDVAASTRIRKTYLHALEEENLQALPGLAYTIGFLRIYARQLGLPAEPLLSTLAGTNADDDRAILPSIGGDYSQSSRKSGKKGKGGRLLLLILLLAAIAATFIFMKPGVPVVAPPQVATAPPESAPISAAVKPQPQATPAAAAQQPVPEQPAVPVTELPVLPAGGAVVRMLPGSAGVMKVSLDNQEVREYQLLPDQSLNWKVTGSLACELSAPGLVRVWVDQQEVAVAEYPAFLLKVGAQQEKRP